MKEHDLTTLGNITTQKLFNIIRKIAEKKAEGIQDKVDFCVVVATNLLGNITIQHSPQDIKSIKINCRRVVEHLNDWFNVVIADLETKKKAN